MSTTPTRTAAVSKPPSRSSIVSGEPGSIEQSLVFTIPKKLFTAPVAEPIAGEDHLTITTEGNSLDDVNVLKRPFRSAVQTLIAESDEMLAEIERLTEEKAALDEEIATLMDGEKIKSVQYGAYKAGYTFSSNSSLNKDLLLANGVPSAVIAASTKTTKFRFFKLTNLVRDSERRERAKVERELKAASALRAAERAARKAGK